ncbi:MAG: hypothetical protein CM1200mP26_15530 [Acidimicrobiales bacterium]|nr:MAG: hypothetical protein CM1200mP26_15530 [Acidimicrobiales bacterium]
MDRLRRDRTVTLSGDPERWLVELDVYDPTTPGEPSDELGTNDDRSRRLLEAATQAVALQGGGDSSTGSNGSTT